MYLFYGLFIHRNGRDRQQRHHGTVPQSSLFGWAVHEGEKVMEIDDGDDGKTKCFLHLERLKWPLGHRPCRRVPYDLQQ